MARPYLMRNPGEPFWLFEDLDRLWIFWEPMAEGGPIKLLTHGSPREPFLLLYCYVCFLVRKIIVHVPSLGRSK